MFESEDKSDKLLVVLGRFLGLLRRRLSFSIFSLIKILLPQSLCYTYITMLDARYVIVGTHESIPDNESLHFFPCVPPRKFDKAQYSA